MFEIAPIAGLTTTESEANIVATIRYHGQRPVPSNGQSVDRVPKGNPFVHLRGEDIVDVVTSLVKSAQKDKPDEATDEEPLALKALYGKNYGSLSPNDGSAKSNSILGNGRSDNSQEFEIHEKTMANLIGRGLVPSVSARRGKRMMATALRQLAEYRWTAEKFQLTAEAVFAESRMRGTAAVGIFHDPALGLARTTWIPTRQLILDPFCDGNLERTRFRGWVRSVPRSSVRTTWGDKVADEAGSTELEDRDRRDYAKMLEHEMESVAVTDFYWSDSEVRRHIVLVENVSVPVEDHAYWPYDLPSGLWPIAVFQWNRLPERVWGATDIKLSQMWHEFVTWSQRFLADAMAISAKTLLLMDKSVDDNPSKIKRAAEDLRTTLSVVTIKLREMGTAGLNVDRLLKFVSVPNTGALQGLTQMLEAARLIVGKVSALDEMDLLMENPAADTPRLAYRKARAHAFLSECLALESFVDIQTLGQQARVKLLQTSIVKEMVDGVEQEVPKTITARAYLDLGEAESLERNLVPNAIRRGLPAEQFGDKEKKERDKRKSVRAWDGANARPVNDDEQVTIENPGIARYVSLPSHVAAWEGLVIPPANVQAEFIFSVTTLESRAVNTESAQRTSAVLSQLTEMYDKFGNQDEVLDYAARYEQSRKDDTELPEAPAMLQNLLVLHDEFVKSVVPDVRLSLRPEQLAYALSKAKATADAQNAAAAEAAAPPPPPPVDEEKMQLEKMKLEIEIARLDIQRQVAEFGREKAQAQAMTEQLKAQTEASRQQAELQKLDIQAKLQEMDFAIKQANLPAEIHQHEARARGQEAAADKAQATAQREMIHADLETQDAQNKAALALAQARKSEASAILAEAQAQAIVNAEEGKATAPPDTKQALEMASGQRQLAAAELDKEKAAAVAKESAAEVAKKKAETELAKADTAATRKEMKEPKKKES